jgi:cell wall-associated NlpC family hydrolase
VRTHGKHRRITTNQRRVATTASLASVAILGSSFTGATASATSIQSGPAVVDNTLTAALVTDPAAPQSGVSAPSQVHPTATLTANHGSVKVGETITFTATEKAPGGTSLTGVAADFFVQTVSGWKQVRSSTLDASGTATFTFKPNYDHGYKVVFADSVLSTDSVEATAATTPTVTVKAVPKDIGPQIVAAAAKEKGRPYVFGAIGPKYFDCSGLVKYVYHQFGINLPHHADSMKHYGKRVSEKDAKPGDLVFVFSGSYAHHVAIYAGHGMWWEASRPGTPLGKHHAWTSNVSYGRV